MLEIPREIVKGGSSMKKSIYRISERMELFISYFICFGVASLFEYLKNIKFKSLLMEMYFKQIYDFRMVILLILSFMVLAFHYQIANRKKTEVYCRIVVGETLHHLVFLYLVENVILLICTSAIFFVLNSVSGLQIMDSVYLLLILVIYIFIGLRMVSKNEVV